MRKDEFLENKKTYIKLDSGIEINDLVYLHPNLVVILAFVNVFAMRNNLDFKITSIIRTPQKDKKLGATSKTHQEGRAFDFSLHGWDYEQVQDLVNQVFDRFSHLGALSASDGLARPIIIHKNASNNGIHAHVQVRP